MFSPSCHMLTLSQTLNVRNIKGTKIIFQRYSRNFLKQPYHSLSINIPQFLYFIKRYLCLLFLLFVILLPFHYISKIIEITNFDPRKRVGEEDFLSLVVSASCSVPCAPLIEHRNSRGYTINPLLLYARVLMKLQRSLFFQFVEFALCKS